MFLRRCSIKEHGTWLQSRSSDNILVILVVVPNHYQASFGIFFFQLKQFEGIEADEGGDEADDSTIEVNSTTSESKHLRHHQQQEGIGDDSSSCFSHKSEIQVERSKVKVDAAPQELEFLENKNDDGGDITELLEEIQLLKEELQSKNQEIERTHNFIEKYKQLRQKVTLKEKNH